MKRAMFGKQHRGGAMHAEDEWCLQMGCQAHRMAGLESQLTAPSHRGLHDESSGGWCQFYGCTHIRDGEHHALQEAKHGYRQVARANGDTSGE